VPLGCPSVFIYLLHRVYNLIGPFIWDCVGAIGDDEPLTLSGEMVRQLNLTIHPGFA
jgi:hypothetical protein